MKKISKILFFTILLSFCLGGLSFIYADQNAVSKWEIDLGIESSIKNPAKLFLGETQLLTAPNDIKPVIVKGTTLIPARAVFESMGYKVDWIDLQKVVLITGNGNEIRLTLDSANALVNNVERPLVVPAMIIDHDKDGVGSTMIPLRFTAEMLGSNVKWIGEENKIVIEKEQASTGEHNVDTQNPPEKSDAELEKEIIAKEEELSKKLVAPEQDMYTYWDGDILNESAKEKIIVIDIGHGGKDRGAVGHENQ
ncbi:MAG: stalk domain-containing protein, partial [Eubacteriales bacterium]